MCMEYLKKILQKVHQSYVLNISDCYLSIHLLMEHKDPPPIEELSKPIEVLCGVHVYMSVTNGLIIV